MTHAQAILPPYLDIQMSPPQNVNPQSYDHDSMDSVKILPKTKLKKKNIKNWNVAAPQTKGVIDVSRL